MVQYNQEDVSLQGPQVRLPALYKRFGCPDRDGDCSPVMQLIVYAIALWPSLPYPVGIGAQGASGP